MNLDFRGFDSSRLPEGTKCATSVNVQLPCLKKELRTGSISRDIALQAQKWHAHRSRRFRAAWDC